MVIDSETNLLYLADCLHEKHPKFFSDLKSILTNCNIQFELLPQTKDIWAVDYMPIQVSDSKFIQFTYDPDYLKYKKWLNTISDVDSICNTIGINTIKSNIVLDGGNIIKAMDKVIMCDKVFFENKTPKKQLSSELRELFEVDKLYFIPQQPKDFTGHADGMVRFINSDTVIINDNSKENKDFQRALKIVLANAELEYIEIPYNPYNNKNDSQANGIYINYLEMENVIIIPTFGINEDDMVIKQFEQLFIGKTIKAIDSNEIADKGGILNCITWNIKQCKTESLNSLI